MYQILQNNQFREFVGLLENWKPKGSHRSARCSQIPRRKYDDYPLRGWKGKLGFLQSNTKKPFAVGYGMEDIPVPDR
jgi:hypothetical protein